MKVIDKYEFGKIVIDGKTYTHDLIIMPDRIIDNWWRQTGHNLCLQDLAEVLINPPEILIIGTGYSGVMTVPPEIIAELEKRGIKTIVEQTPLAVKRFNELSKSYKVSAALHLTC
ncbi:MAG: MTH938/NDUFAF3 family protein [Candidatus Sumerlaeia bacterium]|nr:MTH938/NDUFAF3 family protein [Candidatus Sumerlaeia bacterium]